MLSNYPASLRWWLSVLSVRKPSGLLGRRPIELRNGWRQLFQLFFQHQHRVGCAEGHFKLLAIGSGNLSCATLDIEVPNRVKILPQHLTNSQTLYHTDYWLPRYTSRFPPATRLSLQTESRKQDKMLHQSVRETTMVPIKDSRSPDMDYSVVRHRTLFARALVGVRVEPHGRATGPKQFKLMQCRKNAKLSYCFKLKHTEKNDLGYQTFLWNLHNKIPTYNLIFDICKY